MSSYLLHHYYINKLVSHYFVPLTSPLLGNFSEEHSCAVCICFHLAREIFQLYTSPPLRLKRLVKKWLELSSR